MNVLLIQPPNPGSDIPPKALFKGYRYPFAPDWGIQCLKAYISGHSRHICHYLDLRLHTAPETTLSKEIEQLQSPGILVIYCRTDQAGEVQAIVAGAKKQYPQIPVTLCGPFPSRYPQHAMAINGVDYALSGDPEAALRNLLDFIDIPQRLKNTPGLQIHDQPPKEAHWLSNIETLTLPDWQDFFWPSYRNRQQTVVPTVRVSRGVTSEDCISPVPNEPLRVWNMNKFANCIHHCTHVGISQVLLTDPPSFWTTSRLAQWCSVLRSVHNAQSWGIQLYPCTLDDEQIDDIVRANGQRIDFIIPSLNDEQLAAFGIELSLKNLGNTVKRLESVGIETNLHIMIGGPNEGCDEISNISRAVQQLAFARIILCPFPFIIGSKLHSQIVKDHENNCDIEGYMKWVHSPWTVSRPTLAWAGETGTEYTVKTIQYFQKSMQRNPKRILKRLYEKTKDAHLIAYLEDKALSLLVHKS